MPIYPQQEGYGPSIKVRCLAYNSFCLMSALLFTLRYTEMAGNAANNALNKFYIGLGNEPPQLTRLGFIRKGKWF